MSAIVANRKYIQKLVFDQGWTQSEFAEKLGMSRAEVNRFFNGKRKRVCTLEIWCELFGKEPSTMKKQDAYELNGIMRKIEGWERYTGNKLGNAKVPGYGVQRIFIRSKQNQQPNR